MKLLCVVVEIAVWVGGLVLELWVKSTKDVRIHTHFPFGFQVQIVHKNKPCVGFCCSMRVGKGSHELANWPAGSFANLPLNQIFIRQHGYLGSPFQCNFFGIKHRTRLCTQHGVTHIGALGLLNHAPIHITSIEDALKPT